MDVCECVNEGERVNTAESGRYLECLSLLKYKERARKCVCVCVCVSVCVCVCVSVCVCILKKIDTFQFRSKEFAHRQKFLNS